MQVHNNRVLCDCIQLPNRRELCFVFSGFTVFNFDDDNDFNKYTKSDHPVILEEVLSATNGSCKIFYGLLVSTGVLVGVNIA